MPSPRAMAIGIGCVLLAAQAAVGASAATQPAAGWIWDRADANASAPEHTLHFRYDFELSARPAHADLLITADNTFNLYVNGVPAAESRSWNQPVRIDIAGGLAAGRNCLAVACKNGGGPGGLFVDGQIEDGGSQVSLASGSAWRASEQPAADWHRLETDVSNWAPAVVLGDDEIAPWNLPKILPQAVRKPALAPPFDWTEYRQRQRAAFATLDPPAAPPGDAAGHPIDRFLAAQWAAESIEPPAVCDDRAFVRRAYLDIVGLPPAVEEVRGFLADTDPDKRSALIDALLAADAGYAEGWMAYWCDLLRNDEQTSIDGLRKPITAWLFDALKRNVPYDQMIAHLLNPGSGGPDGYLMGVNWRGRVNASQRPEMQAAQNVGQVFLGTNIKCASCHDHFTRPYLLDDSYALASFFAEKNLEIYRCDKAIGAIAPPRFLIPDLGEVAEDANLRTRHEAVAGMVTSPRNPRFARTMANRLWKRLMGHGLVEPVDDFHAKPSNAALLDWLAYEFMRRDFDLKGMIRLVMTSRAYQLESTTETDEDLRAAVKQAPVFRGPTLRRLTSEQLMDGMCQLVGYWPAVEAMRVEVANPNVRAWRHRVPSSLALALGRPSREQVTTQRDEAASMLQMLEMVNGEPLNQLIRDGVQHMLAAEPVSPESSEALLDALFMRALARGVTDPEKEILVPLLAASDGSGAERQTGWEDVCWMLVLSPEFQYIH